jgi:hypothetical protein
VPDDRKWWEETFGATHDTVTSLEDRVARLERMLREDQRIAGEARQRTQEAHNRLSKAKDAIELAFGVAMLPIIFLSARYIWERYDGWEFVAGWLGAGALITALMRDVLNRIGRI